MATFGLKYFLDVAGCKLVFYLHKVARGVSLSTTSLLSGFQAIKFCPRICLWVDFRIRSTKCIGFCSFLFWILQLLVNVCIPIRVIGPRSSKNISVKTNYGYRSSLMPDKFISLLHAVTLSYMDVICLGFMIWTSGYMVLFLHRHKQQVQHIHSNRLSPTPSHEAMATRTTLIIVSSFVYFYCLSSILSLCITLIVNPKQ
ncbi:vomeronasal type-1 receptor 1-like [Kogia breviceps]|uniref:vomeronasal type-1 receptor 1-like n=1 Tax=Kogia breviceps TaxID=27615 RepID=UPI0034D277CB